MTISRFVTAVVVSLAFVFGSAVAHAQVAPAQPAGLAVAQIIMSKTGDVTAPVTTISRADGRFFVTVRVTNPARTETSIKVSIERPGAAPSAGARELAIPAQARYRTVARFPARRPAGHYRIVVRDAAGAELSALEFDVTE